MHYEICNSEFVCDRHERHHYTCTCSVSSF